MSPTLSNLFPKRVSVLGNGNWGTTIGKLIASNITQFPTQFNPQVKMFTYEETLENGEKLSESINRNHENKKYLPDIKLPSNLISITSIKESCKDSDIIFLVLPFQFITPYLQQLRHVASKQAYCVTLCKGIYFDNESSNLKLLSRIANEHVGVPCYSLMGANIAQDVAKESLCETTIGCNNLQHFDELSKILKNQNFLIQNSLDVVAVEMFGALKNIYAFGYGVLSEINNITNCTLVILLRMAMIEMLLFIKNYCVSQNIECYDLDDLTLHSCSYSDLIASSMAGRNARMGRLFSKDFYEKGHSKTVEEYEKENLNGQKIQGTLTANECFKYLEATNQLDKYPLMTTIHRIAKRQLKPHDLLEAIRNFKYTPKNI